MDDQGGARVGKDLDQTVQKAIEEVRRTEAKGADFEYDEIWCVFDVEQRAQLAADARASARRNGFHTAISNPAFEVWLLAHFQRTATAFLDASAVCDVLDAQWQRHFGCGYDKADRAIFHRLRDRVEDAVANARSVREEHFAHCTEIIECNAATDVYRLVECLRFP